MNKYGLIKSIFKFFIVFFLNVFKNLRQYELFTAAPHRVKPSRAPNPGTPALKLRRVGLVKLNERSFRSKKNRFKNHVPPSNTSVNINYTYRVNA